MITSTIWKVEIRTRMFLDATQTSPHTWGILVPAESVNEALYKVREALIEDTDDPKNARFLPGSDSALNTYEVVRLERAQERVITGPSDWE